MASLSNLNHSFLGGIPVKEAFTCKKKKLRTWIQAGFKNEETLTTGREEVMWALVG